MLECWYRGFGAEYFDVVPDMITCAKGLTNAMVPAGEWIFYINSNDTICGTR